MSYCNIGVIRRHGTDSQHLQLDCWRASVASRGTSTPPDLTKPVIASAGRKNFKASNPAGLPTRRVFKSYSLPLSVCLSITGSQQRITYTFKTRVGTGGVVNLVW